MTLRQQVHPVAHHPRVTALGRSLTEQERISEFAWDLASWLVGVPRDELGPLARVVTLVAQRELRQPRMVCKNRPLVAVEAAARAVEIIWPLLRLPDEQLDELDEDDFAEETGGESAPAEGAETDGGEASDEMEIGAGRGAGEADESGESPEDREDVESPESGESDSDDQESGDEESDGVPEAGQDGDSAEAKASDGGDEGEAGDSLDADGFEDVDIEALLAALAKASARDNPELSALADRLEQQMGPDQNLGQATADLFDKVRDSAMEGAIETERLARYLEHFLPGVGWSTAPGQLQQTLLQKLDTLVALLGQMKELGQLADALGRLEDGSRKQGIQEGGREEVIGVRLSGDVANALPSELALLGDPDTEYLFYSRFLEKRLVTLELSGAGDEGRAKGDKKGPIIACIDTSASMQGPREMAAKALVLAVCRRALPRGRVVHLLLFGGPGERTELRLRRGLGGLEELIDFLTMSFSSGTDFDGPLMRATELLEERELNVADILVVTDGLCHASRAVIQQVEQARQNREVRIFSVVLGKGNTRGVQAFSDTIWVLDPRNAVEAVQLLHQVS
ncbi:MAG: VWA domain-containing protein [Proteobacteria bacterium]|jgi:uncharacterized protein with von Willebrand factor type A (vWA) domain|nr:VWA domain-containing protein [Pseudomonadota bacterium]